MARSSTARPRQRAAEAGIFYAHGATANMQHGCLVSKRSWAVSLVAVVTLLGDAVGNAQMPTPPLPAYRPSSLSDLVDAVSLNRVGLEDVDLSGDVADHSLFLGDRDGVGIAARLQDDPDGPIFLGWQRRGAAWTIHRVVDADMEGVRRPSAAPIRLGRVMQFRPVADHLVLETRQGSNAITSVVLGADLRPVACIAGSVVGGLPAGVFAVLRAMPAGAGSLHALDRLDVRILRLETAYAVRRSSPLAVPVGNQAATDDHAFREVSVDAAGGTVTFIVEPESPAPSRVEGSQSAGQRDRVRVTCTLAESTPQCRATVRSSSLVSLSHPRR